MNATSLRDTKGISSIRAVSLPSLQLTLLSCRQWVDNANAHKRNPYLLIM